MARRVAKKESGLADLIASSGLVKAAPAGTPAPAKPHADLTRAAKQAPPPPLGTELSTVREAPSQEVSAVSSALVPGGSGHAGSFRAPPPPGGASRVIHQSSQWAVSTMDALSSKGGAEEVLRDLKSSSIPAQRPSLKQRMDDTLAAFEQGSGIGDSRSSRRRGRRTRGDVFDGTAESDDGGSASDEDEENRYALAIRPESSDSTASASRPAGSGRQAVARILSERSLQRANEAVAAADDMRKAAAQRAAALRKKAEELGDAVIAERQRAARAAAETAAAEAKLNAVRKALEVEDSLTEEKAAAEAARVAAEVQAARDEGKRAVEALRTQLLTAQTNLGWLKANVMDAHASSREAGAVHASEVAELKKQTQQALADGKLAEEKAEVIRQMAGLPPKKPAAPAAAAVATAAAAGEGGGGDGGGGEGEAAAAGDGAAEPHSGEEFDDLRPGSPSTAEHRAGQQAQRREAELKRLLKEEQHQAAQAKEALETAEQDLIKARNGAEALLSREKERFALLIHGCPPLTMASPTAEELETECARVRGEIQKLVAAGGAGRPEKPVKEEQPGQGGGARRADAQTAQERRQKAAEAMGLGRRLCAVCAARIAPGTGGGPLGAAPRGGGKGAAASAAAAAKAAAAAAAEDAAAAGGDGGSPDAGSRSAAASDGPTSTSGRRTLDDEELMLRAQVLGALSRTAAARARAAAAVSSARRAASAAELFSVKREKAEQLLTETSRGVEAAKMEVSLLKLEWVPPMVAQADQEKVAQAVVAMKEARADLYRAKELAAQAQRDAEAQEQLLQQRTQACKEVSRQLRRLEMTLSAAEESLKQAETEMSRKEAAKTLPGRPGRAALMASGPVRELLEEVEPARAEEEALKKALKRERAESEKALAAEEEAAKKRIAELEAATDAARQAEAEAASSAAELARRAAAAEMENVVLAGGMETLRIRLRGAEAHLAEAQLRAQQAQEKLALQKSGRPGGSFVLRKAKAETLARLTEMTTVLVTLQP